jgi:hypothetical protein
MATTLLPLLVSSLHDAVHARTSPSTQGVPVQAAGWVSITSRGAPLGASPGALAMMIASRFQQPKSDEELHGLVHGLEIHDASDAAVYPWHKNPVILGVIVLLLAASGYGLIYLL